MNRVAYRTGRDRRAARAAPLLALAALMLAATPAWADDDDESGGSFIDRMESSISKSFSGATKAAGFGKPPKPPQVEAPSGCPAIEVLDGTGAQRISDNAAAGNAGLRHQYSISDVARECHVSGGQMTLKVGVEGKVLLGPIGAPGQFSIPVRIAVVDRADDKPVVSKLYSVAASIPAGQGGTSYSLVADQIVVSFAAGRKAADYGIKVGIDTAGKSEGGAKAARPRKPAKPVAANAQ